MLPRRCTVRELVAKHLDINSVPRRYFWELMSQFTDDDLEREKLQEFCTAEGQACQHCQTPDTIILAVMTNIWFSDMMSRNTESMVAVHGAANVFVM